MLLPLITIGVHTLGWRDVMFYSGIFMAVIVVPLAMVIRHSPESMGIEPDLEPDRGDRPQSNSASRAATYDFTVGEAGVASEDGPVVGFCFGGRRRERNQEDCCPQDGDSPSFGPVAPAASMRIHRGATTPACRRGGG